MFIRRLFYNPETGEVLHSYMMQGDIKPLSAAQEAARLGITDYAYFEWTSPDSEIEQNFTDSYGRVSVDVSGEEPALVFDFSQIQEPEDETADMLAALDTLGYEEATNG